jgi:peptidoglycan/xylan/chitin deacetylase (PgdA/CDA1 family)
MTTHTVPYTYSPIVDREPLAWPGGKKVAVYVGLNIEHFLVGKPSTSIWPGTAELLPDPLNHGWRDYGARVGIWRIIDILDRHGVRASALVNSTAVEEYPRIVEAGVRRDWAWLAHGRTNSALHAGFASEDEERAELAEVVGTIEKATGRRPRGWMGPGLTETFATPRLLAELGLTYVLDWTHDDQPAPLTVPGVISVPYSVEINDLQTVTGGRSGAEFAQMIRDAYDQLRSEGDGRVLAIAIHPFVIGQAFRARYLDEALAYLAAQPDAWLTTSDDIAAHYLAG